MAKQKPKVSKKLQQFLDELNELQEKYQYRIKAVLNVTTAGIAPTISVVEHIPEKTPKSKTDKKKGAKK